MTIVISYILFFSPFQISGKEKLLVYLNAKVFTMNGDSVTEAIAVRSGKIVFTGSNAMAKKYAGKNGVYVDIGKRIIIPGIHDSLIDFSLGSALIDRGYDLRGKNLAGSLELFRKRIAKNPAKEGTILYMFDQLRFNSFEWPSRYDLDKISINRPVAAVRMGRGAIWMNSAALNLPGLKNLVGSKSREHMRFGDGSLRGIILNRSTKTFFSSDFFLRNGKIVHTEKMILKAMKYLNSLGITSVTTQGDIGLIKLLKKMESSGKLTLRFFIGLPSENLGSYLINSTDLSGTGDYVRKGYIYLPFDGEIGTFSAAMFVPYKNNGLYGYFVNSPAKMHGILEILSQKNLFAGVRCQGDRAVYRLLGLLKGMKKKKKKYTGRIRIENLKFITDIDIKKIEPLGAVPIVLPLEFAYESLYYDRLFPQREGERSIPLKTFVDNKIRFAFGSGWPAYTASPFKSIYFAVTRKNPDNPDKNDIWFENERLGIMRSLQAYTLNGAFASKNENRSGMIKEGYDADFTVLENFPKGKETGYEHEILKIRVWMTVINGKTVFKRGN